VSEVEYAKLSFASEDRLAWLAPSPEERAVIAINGDTETEPNARPPAAWVFLAPSAKK